jgi:translation initiation factor IF-2
VARGRDSPRLAGGESQAEGGRPLRAHPSPCVRVVPAEGRTRGCWARASVSATGRASCAGAGPREAEEATAVATLARVLTLLTPQPGLPPSSRLPSLPSALECGGTASFRAARLPLDLSARVSGGSGVSLGVRGGAVFLVPLCLPPLQAGRCLFLETLFGHSGSPGSPSNSRPPPSLSPSRFRHPGSPAHPCPLPVAWSPLAASFQRAGLRPGVGGVGPRPLGSWSLLCSRPAPPRPARGGGRGAEAAPGRPRAGSALALALALALVPAPGFFRLSRPG